MFRNKADSVAWANDLLRHKFYILDFETTGKPDFKTGYFPEPLSIAIITVLPYEDVFQGVNDSKCFDVVQLIKPLDAIEEGAKAVHGIDETMLADKPSFKDIYLDIAKLLHKENVVAYNASFETPVLERACRDHGLPCIKPNFSCAMLAYSAFNGTLNEWGNLKWWKLSDACLNHGINPDGAHDALIDVRLTHELIKVIAKG